MNPEAEKDVTKLPGVQQDRIDKLFNKSTLTGLRGGCLAILSENGTPFIRDAIGHAHQPLIEGTYCKGKTNTMWFNNDWKWDHINRRHYNKDDLNPMTWLQLYNMHCRYC